MKEKLLTISVAGYDVGKYINKTLDSFIINDYVLEQIEVIVVDDGATDDTAEKVKPYTEKYPDTFIFIHKENGGYGSTINSSLKIARGRYFRTVDGDDWVFTENLEEYLKFLESAKADMIITNFSRVIDKSFEEEEINHGLSIDSSLKTYDDFIVNIKDALTMHCLTFLTSLLRREKLNITEHCYYTDTEYVLKGMLSVNSVQYLPLKIYMYRVGRDEQSVSISSRVKHIDQSIKVALLRASMLQDVEKREDISLQKKKYFEQAILPDLGAQYFYLLNIKETKNARLILDDFNSKLRLYPFCYSNSCIGEYGKIVKRLQKHPEKIALYSRLYLFARKCYSIGFINRIYNFLRRR